MEPRRNVNEEKNSETRMGVERKDGAQVEKEVVIDRTPQEVYRFWRKLENLPRFMHHLKSVREIDAKRSHWVARGPLGKDVEWDAEIVNDVPDERIGWQSLPDADVRNAGSVQFIPNGKNSTTVRVVLRYDPPAGKVGEVVAKLLGENPEHEVEADLKRLQTVLDSGETQVRRAA